MRDTVIKTLIELGKKDRNVELITGDLGFGVLKPFWEQLPDQFINAGIAEQCFKRTVSADIHSGGYRKYAAYSVHTSVYRKNIQMDENN